MRNDGTTTAASAVYGPVRSWRVGLSLGIDLICVNSICSFNCTYCQLGSIQVRTAQRQLFVPTSKVLHDLEKSDWKSSDIVTYSGSGEPTLALNLGEVIREIKRITGKPSLVLTNGTLLHLPEVREELTPAERVYVKLDAPNAEILKKVNRPADGVSFEQVVQGTVDFRNEFDKYLGLQLMLLYPNYREVQEFARLINRIRPDEVQVNAPTRPYPQAWHLASRGSHEGVDYPAKSLKTLSVEEIISFSEELQKLTEVEIVSVSQRKAALEERASRPLES